MTDGPAADTAGDAARWERAQAVFHAADDLPPAEQRALVARRCAGDAALAAAVLALLDGDARGAPVLDRGVAHAARAVFGGGPTGARAYLPATPFGPYRVVRLLGEGGMGVVYLAERADLGSVAAVKLLRDAWLSPARRERFAREQRTLAQLNHPAIARLYDAGTLDDGTPWIAMEYVDGVCLTDHCRARAAPLGERLRLFRAVCEAVGHAHRHLVVHRDLKPSNILVARDGGVKLLDFGIAKQLDADDVPNGTPNARLDTTRTGLRLLTPAYAAPEQLRGDAVGVHTDVYALGVVLYELLAGRLPFDVAHRTPGEAEAVILAEAPVRPSAAARRAGESGAPVSGVRAAAWADLDVLCLTAMHKEPQRRYPTVEALARDVDHFLAGEPLEARPDAAGYRLGKFARRHRAPLAAAGLALAAAAGMTAFHTARLTAARDAAVAESVRTARIQRFMLGLFEGGDEDTGPSDSLRVVTLVDRGVRELSALGEEPVVQAELYQTLGGISHQLGRLDGADSLLGAALVRRRALHGAEHPDVARSLVALGLLRTDQARLPEAERLVRDGLAMTQRRRPPGHPDVAAAFTALGRVLEERGGYDQAIAVLDAAARAQAALGIPRDAAAAGARERELAATLGQLANNHFYAGHYDAADSLNRRVLAMSRRLYGPRHPRVGDDFINLGAVQFERGRYPEAERHYRAGVALIEPWYGRDHPRTASALTMLARALVAERRYDDAAPLVARVLAVQERVYGPVHPRVASALNELGTVALGRGRYDDADRAFARMADVYRRVHGGNHSLLGVATANRGSVALKRGDARRAEGMFRAALAVYARTLPAGHLNVGVTRVKLGRALVRQRRWTEAEGELLGGLAILTAQTSPSVSWVTSAREDLAAVYDALGNPARAAGYRAPAAAGRP